MRAWHGSVSATRRARSVGYTLGIFDISALNTAQRGDLLISNGGRTIERVASTSGTTYLTARVTPLKTSGKYIAAFTADSITTNNGLIGVADNLLPNGGYLGYNTGANSLGVFAGSGSPSGAASGSASAGPAWVTGSVVLLAVDISSGKVWHKMGAGNWNQNAANDPDAGSGAFLLQATVDKANLYFAVTLAAIGSKITLNPAPTGHGLTTFLPLESSGSSSGNLGMPARTSTNAPRLYIDGTDVAGLQARWSYAESHKNDADGAAGASIWRNEYYRVTLQGNPSTGAPYTSPAAAALRHVCSPSDTFTGTIGNQVDYQRSVTGVPYGVVAVHTAWAELASMTYSGGVNGKGYFVYEFFSMLHEAAVAYDWCRAYIFDINPLTDNTYAADIRTEMARCMMFQDEPGTPSNTTRPTGTIDLPFSAPRILNGHVAQGATVGNFLASAVAFYDEDPSWFNAMAQVQPGQSRSVIQQYEDHLNWKAPAHHSASSNYYTHLHHWAGARLLLKKLGYTFLTDEFARQVDQWIYLMRPDGMMMRYGDTVDERYRTNSVFRHSAGLMRMAFRNIADTEYAKRLSYLWEVDRTRYAKGTRENYMGGSMYGAMWDFEAEAAMYGTPRVLLFALGTDADKNEAYTYASGSYHPNLANATGGAPPLIKHFPHPASEIVHRTGWNWGGASGIAGLTDAVIHVSVGSYQWSGHAAKNQLSVQVYYKGPLTGAMGLYQGSLSAWGGSYNKDAYKQGASRSTVQIGAPSMTSSSHTGAYADGGVRWPFPDYYVGATGYLRGNPDQPHRLDDITATYGPGNKDGFLLVDPTTVSRYVDTGMKVSYISGDAGLGFSASTGGATDLSGNNRATAVRRSVITVTTDNATYPIVLFVADRMDIVNSAFKARVLWQAISTVNNESTGRYWWKNGDGTFRARTTTGHWQNDGTMTTGRPGQTPAESNDGANPNFAGMFYATRDPYFSGPYNGRLTVVDASPVAATYETISYPNSATAGINGAQPLKKMVLKNDTSGVVNTTIAPDGEKVIAIDPGSKGPNSSNTYPNGEDGYARLELKKTGATYQEFLSVLACTDSTQSASTVTAINTATIMGARYLDFVGLFSRSTGYIGAAGTGTYASGITLSGNAVRLLAEVAAGTWEVRIGGTIVGSAKVVDANTKFIDAAAVGPGALTLVRTA